jgi:hypothetical protein
MNMDDTVTPEEPRERWLVADEEPRDRWPGELLSGREEALPAEYRALEGPDEAEAEVEHEFPIVDIERSFERPYNAT